LDALELPNADIFGKGFQSVSLEIIVPQIRACQKKIWPRMLGEMTAYSSFHAQQSI